jgi:hypothetical protein
VLVRFVFCSKILKKKSHVCKTLERRWYGSTERNIYTRDFTRLLHLSQVFDRLLLLLLVAKGKCFEYKTQRKGFLLGQKDHGHESTVVWEWNAGTLCERSVFAASRISRVPCWQTPRVNQSLLLPLSSSLKPFPRIRVSFMGVVDDQHR